MACLLETGQITIDSSSSESLPCSRTPVVRPVLHSTSLSIPTTRSDLRTHCRGFLPRLKLLDRILMRSVGGCVGSRVGGIHIGHIRIRLEHLRDTLFLHRLEYAAGTKTTYQARKWKRKCLQHPHTPYISARLHASTIPTSLPECVDCCRSLLPPESCL